MARGQRQGKAASGRGRSGNGGRNGNSGRRPQFQGHKQKSSRDMRDGGSRSQRSESRGAKRSALTAKQRRPVSDLIEGRRAVAEALDAGIPLKSAFVQDSLADSDSALSSLVRRLDGEGVPVETVPRSRLDQLSSHGAHQGIVVRTRPFEYASVEDVIAAAGEGDALVVVLDHVTDEGNFGAIVRSAEVVGAAGVVIANTRAATVGVGAYKTSAGAVLHIPIAQVPNLPRAIDQLKEAGFWACAATEHAEQDVWSAPLGGRLALVMGSEGEGISRLVLDHCDFGARLPQRGRVESLNVAQAATVMCYEWLRRVSQKGEGAELDG